jgi:hypothetical protein
VILVVGTSENANHHKQPDIEHLLSIFPEFWRAIVPDPWGMRPSINGYVKAVKGQGMET